MNNIRWVIQNNLIAENDLQEIQHACKSLGIEFEEILVVPFSEEMPAFTMDGKTNIYYGSTTLMYNIYKKLNKPRGLFFDEEKFSMQNYIHVWKDKMLNYEAKITTFREFSKETHAGESLWFIRPDADDKSFAGDVKSFKSIKNFIQNATKVDNVNLTEDTKIVVGPPYNIKKEWRNFIVNGKVVASSLYRKDFKLSKSATDVPAGMIQFVEDSCKEYQPHAIFVMDIALCTNQYYIIECGCLNSTGFYAASIHDIIDAVSEFVSGSTK